MSDLVRNPEDRFSLFAAQFIRTIKSTEITQLLLDVEYLPFSCFLRCGVSVNSGLKSPKYG